MSADPRRYPLVGQVTHAGAYRLDRFEDASRAGAPAAMPRPAQRSARLLSGSRPTSTGSRVRWHQHRLTSDPLRRPPHDDRPAAESSLSDAAADRRGPRRATARRAALARRRQRRSRPLPTVALDRACRWRPAREGILETIEAVGACVRYSRRRISTRIGYHVGVIWGHRCRDRCGRPEWRGLVIIDGFGDLPRTPAPSVRPPLAPRYGVFAEARRGWRRGRRCC